MRYLLTPLQWIYCIYAYVLFIVIMLLIFPFAIFASIFGIIRGGNMIYSLCMLWADLWFFSIFIRHRNIYEEPHDRSRQYIFVINHNSYLDAAILVKAIRQPLRPLAKVEMSKVPVFGFIYRYAVVGVNRGDSKNRLKKHKKIEGCATKGYIDSIFPEGTFNLTHKPLKEFFDGAFRIAIETNTTYKTGFIS